MLVADFNYHLPPELVAQYPAGKRETSRMLVMDRDTGHCEVRTFLDFPSLLQAGDCLVLNDTRVIPARLLGRRVGTDGRVEALLLRELAPLHWHCLLKPGRRLRPGTQVTLGEQGDRFTVHDRRADGTFEVRFDTDDMPALLARLGAMPLPPYIRRQAETSDRERYQTVYAREPGAVAAPTAGLHFTADILDSIRNKGVSIATVTLHVGAGTFQPVKVDCVQDHRMHEEVFVLPQASADTVNRTRAGGGRVVAVGTTSVRVLESCAVQESRTVAAQAGTTRLFLHPPAKPVVVDALLTNFHLPRSTLLMLVATFSSVEHVLDAYRLAVRERFRFYSYGDCMLLT